MLAMTTTIEIFILFKLDTKSMKNRNCWAEDANLCIFICCEQQLCLASGFVAM